MAHFAKLVDNIVTGVIVVSNNDILDDEGNESEAIGIAFCKKLFGEDTTWLQTSFNGRMRGKYAGIGDTYDPITDMFISNLSPELETT